MLQYYAKNFYSPVLVSLWTIPQKNELGLYIVTDLTVCFIHFFFGFRLLCSAFSYLYSVFLWQIFIWQKKISLELSKFVPVDHCEIIFWIIYQYKIMFRGLAFKNNIHVSRDNYRSQSLGLLSWTSGNGRVLCHCSRLAKISALVLWMRFRSDHSLISSSHTSIFELNI